MRQRLSQKFHTGAQNGTSRARVKITLAGGGYAYYKHGQKPPELTISTAHVTRGDVVEAVAATGALQAVTTVQVGTQASGTIRELNADFNSLVHKGQRPRQRNQTPAARPAQTAGSSATTFDALFGPLAPTHAFGQVWLNVDGKLQRVRLHLGIGDGQQNELLQVIDGNVQEGAEVVTNVLTGAVRQTPAVPAGNAFPGMVPQRGFGGGGAGGG